MKVLLTGAMGIFGDWVDTEESQRLLQYQKRGLSEQVHDMKKDFGMLVPVIRLVRPLATWFVTRSSAHLKKNRRRASVIDEGTHDSD